MSIIRSGSDLRNSCNAIPAFYYQYSNPVSLTKNGVGDFVALRIDVYEKLVGEYRL